MAFVEICVSEAVAKAAQEQGITCAQDPVWKSWTMKLDTEFLKTREGNQISFEDEDEILKLYISNSVVFMERWTLASPYIYSGSFDNKSECVKNEWVI